MMNIRTRIALIITVLIGIVSSLQAGAQAPISITPENALRMTEVRRLGPGMTYGAAVHPDGNLLAVASGNDVVLYKLPSLEPHRFLEGDTGVLSVAFSPDGKILASAHNERTIIFWDITTHTKSNVIETSSSTGKRLGFSWDGRYLAYGNDRRMNLLDVTTAEEADIFRRTGLPQRIAFSPDGTRLATIASNELQLRSLTTGDELTSYEMDENERLYDVAYSPDGKFLATSMDWGITLWNTETGIPVQTFQNDRLYAGNIRFSPDNRTLALNLSAIAHPGGWLGWVVLFDVVKGEILTSLGGHDYSADPAFLPDGESVVTVGPGQINLWNAATGEKIKGLQGVRQDANSIAFSPDGEILAAGSLGHIKLWNVEDGTAFIAPVVPMTYANPAYSPFRVEDVNITSLAFSPDGEVLASSSEPGYGMSFVKLWDVSRGSEVATIKGRNYGANSIAFSPDGGTLAMGSQSQSGSIKFWDVGGPGGITVHETPGGVMSIAFAPDGETLAAGGYSTITLWQLSGSLENQVRWEQTAVLEGHEDFVNSVAFSPDGALLASASDDHTVRLWDVSSAQEIAILEGHTGRVRSVTFSPDGQVLVSGGWDGKVILWDVAGREELIRHTGSGSGFGDSVAFSPDGTLLAWTYWDNTIRLWGIVE